MTVFYRPIQLQCVNETCGHLILLHPDLWERLKKTHAWFYCPFGHRQHFVSKTDWELKIERLERELCVTRVQKESAERNSEYWREKFKRPRGPGGKFAKKVKP